MNVLIQVPEPEPRPKGVLTAIAAIAKSLAGFKRKVPPPLVFSNSLNL
jgi:hypothetical protein